MNRKTMLKPLFAMMALSIIILIIVLAVVMFTPKETMLATDTAPVMVEDQVEQIELDTAAPPHLNP